MSNQARRYERNSNQRSRKITGNSDHTSKPKFEEQRARRSQDVPLIGKTVNQKRLISSLYNDVLTIANGAGGVGKSYVSLTYAAKQLLEGKTDKIIIVRCYQPLAGRTVGFLKGSDGEKMRPFVAQQIQYLEGVLGKADVELRLANGTIEICLLEAVRGRNFDNCIVVVDEAQLLIPAEVQALVTRIGEDCQMVLIGDTNQRDVKGDEVDGLSYIERLINNYDIHDADIIQFHISECQRSGVCKRFLEIFDTEGYL
jgi:phosphate starvation-inducible PhoH-like protein